MDTSPTHYDPTTPSAVDESHLKPWQRRLPGETEKDRVYRALRSCWMCGHFESDPAKLEDHEQAH